MPSPKQIVIKLFIFLLPLVIAFGFIEYKLRTKHFVSSYAAKKYYLEKQLDNVETLVVGSSQMFNGIDVGYFNNNAFNIANVSQTLYYDKRLTLQYLPKLPKLKTVIVGVSYFSFFYQLCDTPEDWREEFYADYYSINGCKYKQKNWLYLKTYQPKQALSLAFNNFKDESASTILANGFQPKFMQKDISDSLGLERVKVHNEENFANRRKEIETDLEDFVQKLTTKNIKVVFVTMPVFTTYSRHCNKNIIEQNTSFVNQLCKKYNCKYLNYFTDERFVKDDFEDNDHLKNNGAKKLSTIINDTLFAQQN